MIKRLLTLEQKLAKLTEEVHSLRHELTASILTTPQAKLRFLGISQREAARNCDMPQATISRVLRDPESWTHPRYANLIEWIDKKYAEANPSHSDE